MIVALVTLPCEGDECSWKSGAGEAGILRGRHAFVSEQGKEAGGPSRRHRFSLWTSKAQVASCCNQLAIQVCMRTNWTFRLPNPKGLPTRIYGTSPGLSEL